MLNMACSGHPDHGFMAGHYYHFVGDSDSGKTFLCMTCFAEASINQAFDGYRLIYDGPEHGALMDVPRFFGRRVADRLENRSSETSQEFYFNTDDDLKRGKPFIIVLDSQDALDSNEARAKFDKQKIAFRKGKEKEEAGSFGDSKAKSNSSNLRRLLGPLEKTGSILILINQTRDSFSMFESSTYSGGKALKFYCAQQLWSSQKGKIKRTVAGKERELGTMCRVRVKKNRVTGRDRTVLVPIYHSHGIDDVGSMVDYLTSEGTWDKDGSTIMVRGLGPEFKSGQERLIAKIEEEDLVADVKALVVQTWNDIEKACEVTRTRRYE
jgi:RecA/RadA recombinase